MSISWNDDGGERVGREIALLSHCSQEPETRPCLAKSGRNLVVIWWGPQRFWCWKEAVAPSQYLLKALNAYGLRRYSWTLFQLPWQALPLSMYIFINSYRPNSSHSGEPSFLTHKSLLPLGCFLPQSTCSSQVFLHGSQNYPESLRGGPCRDHHLYFCCKGQKSSKQTNKQKASGGPLVIVMYIWKVF